MGINVLRPACLVIPGLQGLQSPAWYPVPRTMAGSRPTHRFVNRDSRGRRTRVVSRKSECLYPRAGASEVAISDKRRHYTQQEVGKT